MTSRIFSSGLLASFASLAVLASCADTREADAIMSFSEDVQVQAHVDCQATRGGYAPEAIHISRLRDGRAMVRTVSGARVSAQKAADVNTCAQQKLLSNGGASIVEVNSHLVVLADTSANPREISKSLKTIKVAKECVGAETILHRGSTICPGY